MSKLRFFNVANMSFDTFRENKILAKISEFYSILSLCILMDFPTQIKTI